MMGLAIAVDGFGMKRVWIEAVGELGQRSYAQRDTKLDCVFAQGSRLKPLLQQPTSTHAFVGAAGAAKPMILRRPDQSPSCCTAVPIFVLIAGGLLDHAVRASRLPSLLQQQPQYPQ